MKKLLFTFLSGLFAVFTAHAQLVESVYFDTRGSVAANGNQFSLKAEYLNLHVRGNLAPNLSYQLRQRFTKPFFKEGSPLNATDILSLTWDISPRWSVSAGKLPIFQGGYEWDAAPIDVYFWNGFAEFIPEIYALGGSLFFNPATGQLVFLDNDRTWRPLPPFRAHYQKRNLAQLSYSLLRRFEDLEVPRAFLKGYQKLTGRISDCTVTRILDAAEKRLANRTKKA